jgi:hypothetical protein
LHSTIKALTVTGIAGALAVTAGGLATAANAATSTTITVTAVQTSSKILKDTAPKGQLNPGDKFQFTEKLLQSGKKIGTDKITVTDEKGNKALADGVFTFKAGTLHAHGTFPFPPPNGKPFNIPIVGGTGAYKGAHGTLTVTQKSQSSSTEVFHFTA